MLHLHRRILRTRHSFTFRHLPLSSLSVVSPTIQHRPRPSHSSTRSVLLQGLRHQCPSLTLGLHRFGCIGKVASPSVLGGTPCEEVEFSDEFYHGGPLFIRLYVRYLPFATCITHRVLHASEIHQAVITVIHPVFVTRHSLCDQTRTDWRCVIGLGRSGAGVGGTGRDYGAELENGYKNVNVEGDDDEGTDGRRRG
jgi:hypothetical protein